MIGEYEEKISVLEVNTRQLTKSTDSHHSLLNETRTTLAELQKQYDILKITQERLANENEVYKKEKNNDEVLIASLQKQTKELTQKYTVLNATTRE